MVDTGLLGHARFDGLALPARRILFAGVLPQIAHQNKSMMGLLLGLALPVFLRPRRPILVSFFLRESMQEQDTINLVT